MKTLALGALSLVMISASHAASQIRVVSTRICNDQGAVITPSLGDQFYGLRVDWTVTGTPNAPYVVKFAVADQTWNFTVTSRDTGNHYAYALFYCPLDGTTPTGNGDITGIPTRVAVDEEGASGDTRLSDNVVTGSFMVNRPATAAETYDPVTLNASQTFSIEWGTGTVNSLGVFLPLPINGSNQDQTTRTPPSGSSVFALTTTQDIAQNSVGSFTAPRTTTFRQQYSVRSFNVRTNFNLLRSNINWSNYGSLSTDVRRELVAEPTLESGSATVANFANQALPTNYRTTIRPVHAARLLFHATLKKMAYDPTIQTSAAQGIALAKGDALTINRVYVAALRYIGIPARIVGGYSLGNNYIEYWSEVYFPGTGWVAQDAAFGEVMSPAGQYAYGFACVPFLNERTIVQRGSNFTLRFNNQNYVVSSLLPGNFVYTGNATFNRWYWTSLVQVAP